MDSCCSNCINDKIISKIIEKEGVFSSKCPICQTKNIKTIHIDNFIDYFEMLLEIYEEDADGDDLAFLIQNDWEIFLRHDIASKLIYKIIPYAHTSLHKYHLNFKTNQFNQFISHFKNIFNTKLP